MVPCGSALALLSWSDLFKRQKERVGVPEATGDREQGRGHAIGRVFIPALEGICNLRVQDF